MDAVNAFNELSVQPDKKSNRDDNSRHDLKAHISQQRAVLKQNSVVNNPPSGPVLEDVDVIVLPDSKPPQPIPKDPTDSKDEFIAGNIGSNGVITVSSSNSPADQNPPKRRPSFSKMIANIFGPKDQKVSPMSPKKVKTPRKSPRKSPKKIIKVPEVTRVSAPAAISANNVDKSNAAQGEKSFAWLARDHVLGNSGVDDVFELDSAANDPEDLNKWSIDVQSGSRENLQNAGESEDYQNMLDSMRLVLESNPVEHAKKIKKLDMSAIPEEKSTEFPGQGDLSDEGSDSTFEESSVSVLEDSDSDIGSNNEWSVCEDDEQESEAVELDVNPNIRVSPLQSPNQKKKWDRVKPLTHYAAENIVPEKLDLDCNNDEEAIHGSNTLYGVPISLSSTIRKDLRGRNNDPSPSVRIENLRIILENRLGEERFLQAYQYLRNVKHNEDDDSEEEEQLLNDMECILGTNGLKYLDVLYQLISAEENFC
jgi:hypothetical protein